MAQIVKRQTSSGESRYDVRARVDGRVVTRTFKRRRDADAFASTLEADRLRGLAVDPREARTAFAVVAARWLSSNPAKRPTTWVADELALRRYIVPAIGGRPIGRVSPGDIQGLVNTWAKRLAPRTVRRHYGVLRAVFAYAVANDVIARSPCRGIKHPEIASTRRCELGADQIAAIAAATPAEHRTVVWVAALLGLRWSEVAGLRVGRLDLDAGTMTIAEAVTRGKGGILVHGMPKSRASQRTIPMPRALGDMLAKHLALRGIAPDEGDALVFGDRNGGPLEYSHWRQRVWLPACQSAGCEGAGFHDLRRANATGMVAEGVNVKTAQQRLGHADVRTTLDIYAQPVEEANRDASEALAARFLPNERPAVS